MGQFISWINCDKEGVLFLTDQEVFSDVGRERLGGAGSAVFGHGAIGAFYRLGPRQGVPHENTEFWKKGNFPPEIAQCLKSPETLINTWDGMLRRALSPQAALSIMTNMTNAPESWRRGLSGICLDVISQSAYHSYRALCDLKLNSAQKSKLIVIISEDANCSYYALCEVRGLNETQRNKLVEGVKKSPYYSYWALYKVKGLDKIQRKVLRAVTKIYKI